MSVRSVLSSSTVLPWLPSASIGGGSDVAAAEAPPGAFGQGGVLFDKLRAALQVALLQGLSEQGGACHAGLVGPGGSALDTLLKEIVEALQNGGAAVAGSTTNHLPAPLNRMVNALALATVQRLQDCSGRAPTVSAAA